MGLVTTRTLSFQHIYIYRVSAIYQAKPAQLLFTFPLMPECLLFFLKKIHLTDSLVYLQAQIYQYSSHTEQNGTNHEKVQMLFETEEEMPLLSSKFGKGGTNGRQLFLLMVAVKQ